MIDILAEIYKISNGNPYLLIIILQMCGFMVMQWLSLNQNNQISNVFSSKIQGLQDEIENVRRILSDQTENFHELSVMLAELKGSITTK